MGIEESVPPRRALKCWEFATLCDVVTASNLAAAANKRNLQISDVSTISSSDDPTSTDPTAQITSTDVDSNSGDIIIDGSTATVASGYSDDKYTQVDQNADATIGATTADPNAPTANSTNSGCLNIISVMIIAFVSLF